MERKKHFVLLDENNNENPVISVIKDITKTEIGKLLFAEKVKGEIESHFDFDGVNINQNDIDDTFFQLFDWSDYISLKVEIEGVTHTIRFIETSIL